MCNKDAPRVKGRCGIDKKSSMSINYNPARKTRTKTRRPKFLSLRVALSPGNTDNSVEMTGSSAAAVDPSSDRRHRQLNLFPLRPDKLIEEKDAHDDNDVGYFFNSGADGGATTLTSLLGARSSSEEDNAEGLSPPSLTYAYRGHEDSEESAHLARTALRNKERDASEERWVCYSEVVERKEEEVSSCCAAAATAYVRHEKDDEDDDQKRQRILSLKLDYEEILNAWSDKGPLYIQLEWPQIVPDLRDDHFINSHDTAATGGWGSNDGGVWRVPEKTTRVSGGGMKMKEDEGGVLMQEVQGHREASVMRYKEKRQSRLFSKRIRYQVRKINAEKRPRMKGRFVKRS